VAVRWTIRICLLLFLGSLLVNACKKSGDGNSGPHPLSFTTPAGFPAPQYSFTGNPLTQEGFELGRKLFYDGRLSKDGNFPCASCHQQSLAFTDGLARAIGSTGSEHQRSSMSLANVAYNATFGWGERTSSLESQMEVPMYNELPVEMGLKGHEPEVIDRFVSDADYVARFRAAFPDDPHPDARHDTTTSRPTCPRIHVLLKKLVNW